jgi:hypothetical protein
MLSERENANVTDADMVELDAIGWYSLLLTRW